VLAASAGAVSFALEPARSDWTVVPAPRMEGQVNLTGVTAFGPRDAWAVGYVGDAVGIRTVTLHWNGARWTRVPSPNPSATRNWLMDVSGSSSSDLWAVGSYWNLARKRRSLAMHWDGSQWTVVPTPNVERKESLVNGVTVLSPTDAWAVGSALDASFSGRTLTHHWDGASWTIVPSPNPSVIGVGSNLLGVTAASSTDVWAVGDIDTGDFTMGTLTEHWDGQSWRAAKSPTVEDGALLADVAVDGDGAEWAVGWRQGGEFLQPLAMRRTRTRWLRVGAPSFAGVAADFAGVAALGPGGVWAVGGRGSRTFAAHWDGASWTVSSTADPGRAANYLVDVTGVPGTPCLWAVGSYVNFGLPTALIERHCHRAGSPGLTEP
jgi:hypothetical protein